MKEKIVIEEEFWVKHFQEREKDFYEEDMCSGGNPEEWWHYEKEKVPENFEELKELCKGMFADITEHSITLFGCLEFWDDGKLSFFHYSDIVNNLTPARQWQIIKSLIGEE